MHLAPRESLGVRIHVAIDIEGGAADVAEQFRWRGRESLLLAVSGTGGMSTITMWGPGTLPRFIST